LVIQALVDSKTSWLGNVGLGAQYLINDSFGLQADLREQWSRAPLGRTAVGATNDNGTVANTLLSLGGIFRFGAPAPMPVIAAAEPAPAAVVEPTPAPAAVEPTPLPVAPKCEPKMETVTLQADQLFGFDKANIKAEGKAALDEVVTKIKSRPSLEVVMITGHTDRLGSASYNQKLSERRANIVKSYLVSKGVSESRLQAIGKGEAMPVVECKGNKATKKLIECLQPNRRVEITSEATVESGCN
jgi:OOP family OmpA-OmpF porin